MTRVFVIGSLIQRDVVMSRVSARIDHIIQNVQDLTMIFVQHTKGIQNVEVQDFVTGSQTTPHVMTRVFVRGIQAMMHVVEVGIFVRETHIIQNAIMVDFVTSIQSIQIAMMGLIGVS